MTVPDWIFALLKALPLILLLPVVVIVPMLIWDSIKMRPRMKEIDRENGIQND